jgi:DnaJ family protein C protein 7
MNVENNHLYVVCCRFQASQFLKRENGDVGSLWKEVSIDEVRADAERLFKLIGEANAILSDPVKVSHPL